MSITPKSYRVKYDVHCKLQNFFNKEMIVKNCLSELHAKAKLDTYYKSKYGVEYQCIVVTKCTCEDITNRFEDILGKDIFKNDDTIINLFKNIKDKKK